MRAGRGPALGGLHADAGARGLAAATPSVMGSSERATGTEVEVPSTSLLIATLNTGSSVLTVCVNEIATAANEMFAAMWPRPCIDAGKRMVLNSSLVIGRPKDA